ncbi:hypothetical protein GNF78_17565, partial [Clostridium perfringens]
MDERLHPHYIAGAEDRAAQTLNPSMSRETWMERLNLRQTVGSAWGANRLESIAKMQAEYAKGITDQRVVKDYKISPSQMYHFQHKDVSGTMVKWTKTIQPELLSQARQQIVSVAEVMRSVF